MFNFHGGTAVGTAPLSAIGLVGAYALQHSGHILIAMGFLALSAISFALLLATLSRFIINFRKHYYAFTTSQPVPDDIHHD